MTIYFVAFLFILMTFLAFFTPLNKHQFSSRYFFVFRIFFPSWKFFDSSSEMYFLKYRIIDDIEQVWYDCPPKLDRKWQSLIINTDANIALACDSAIKHLCTDIYDLQNSKDEIDTNIDLTNTNSYKIINNIIEYFIENKVYDISYQFKIVALSSTQSEDIILISPIHCKSILNKFE